MSVQPHPHPICPLQNMATFVKANLFIHQRPEVEHYHVLTANQFIHKRAKVTANQLIHKMILHRLNVNITLHITQCEPPLP